MNCQDAQSYLIDELTGQLSQHDATNLAGHLDACTECSRESKSLSEAWAALATLVDPVDPPAELKGQLLARLGSAPAAPSNVVENPAATRRPPPEARQFTTRSPWRTSRGLLAAAAMIGVVVGVSATQLWRLYDPLGTRADQELIAADRRLAEAIRAAERDGAGAKWHLASFSIADQPDRTGFLVWDPLSRELHFYAMGLPLPGPGKTYRLWLITENDLWIAVGDPTVNEGVFQLLTTAPVALSNVRSSVLTEVSAGAASEADHGPIVLNSNFAQSGAPSSR